LSFSKSIHSHGTSPTPPPIPGDPPSPLEPFSPKHLEREDVAMRVDRL